MRVLRCEKSRLCHNQYCTAGTNGQEDEEGKVAWRINLTGISRTRRISDSRAYDEFSSVEGKRIFRPLAGRNSSQLIQMIICHVTTRGFHFKFKFKFKFKFMCIINAIFLNRYFSADCKIKNQIFLCTINIQDSLLSIPLHTLDIYL